MPKAKGFTLIELMVVMVIIGVLASIAMPQYQDYIGRAQAAEAITATAGLRAELALYHAENGSFQGYADQAGVLAPQAALLQGQYIAAGGVTLLVDQTGGFQIMFNRGVHQGLGLIMQPLINGQLASGQQVGQLSGWRCQGQGLAPRFLPSACQQP